VKYLLNIFSLLTIFITGQAFGESNNISLKIINNSEFDQLSSVIENIVAKDNRDDWPVYLDKKQSFQISRNNEVVLKLLPFAYLSKKARNKVCHLAIFSKANQFREMLPLLYVVPYEDEIVGSCQGVNAVTTQKWNNQELIIYLLRERVANTYGDTVFIGAIKSDKIIHLKELSDCVSGKDNIDSMKKVRAAVKQCSAELKHINATRK
jgi:hypothetical protein